MHSSSCLQSPLAKFIRNLLTTLALIGTCLVDSTAHAASIRSLGRGAGYPTDVSADGSVVVGQNGFSSFFGSNPIRAFRWTEPTGAFDLGRIDSYGANATASAVSADGSVVVGSSDSINGHQAIRWTAATGMVPLGRFPGDSHAFGVSADGSVVLGVGNRGEYFRWTQTEGMQPLAPGALGGSIAAVSADASTVVWNFNGATWRWTPAEGVVNLGNPLKNSSGAFAMSADGAVVVGGTSPFFDGEAWRWTEATGFVPLGVSGQAAAAMAVSADGSVAVGRGENRGQKRAFYWSEARGLRWLDQMLTADYGLDLTGYQLEEATAISADGRTIVGYGPTQSWIVTIPEPSATLLLVLGAAALSTAPWHRASRTRLLAAGFALSVTAGSTIAHAATIDTVPVGNAGNQADPTGFGSVGYEYRIATTEVTNAQYVEFLNGVDPTGANTLALYNSEMSSNALGGINVNVGAANGSKYEIKSGRGNNPVVFVSWYDATRFANWLHNGWGGGDTENGAYALLGATPTPSNGNSITREAGARWFLPSENEWYKSAYHKNDGSTDHYWDYPNSSNGEPYSDMPPGSDSPDPSNAANYVRDDGIANGYNDGFAVTGSTAYDINQDYLTDVGTYSFAKSPYGTFDQGGNAWEWNETFNETFSYRGIRGGSWATDRNSFYLHRTLRLVNDPMGETVDIGFRVATVVPEPCTLIFLSLGAVLLPYLRRKIVVQLLLVAGFLGQSGMDSDVAHADSVRTVAVYNHLAPGTAGGYFYSFGAPVINDRGQVAFWANLFSDLIKPEGIWSEGSGTLAPVALSGTQAPDAASGMNFRSFTTPCTTGGLYGCRWLGSPVVMNDAGQVAFPASLTFADTAGVWMQGSGGLAASAITGLPAPGTGIDFYQVPGFPQAMPAINSSGRIAFGARADSRYHGIWSDSAGALSLLGQASSLTAPALNDLGQTAFAVQRLTSTFINAPGLLHAGGVYVQQADALSLVVPKESQPPATASGVSFGHRLYGGLDSQTFGRPGLNNSGQVAFRALIRGIGVDVANDEGVWSNALGNMMLIARERDQAPGAPDGIIFSVARQSAAPVAGDTPAAFGDPVLNNAGQVAFRAGLGTYGTEAGIWSTDRTGALRLVARSGEQAPGLPGGVNFDYLADSRYTPGDVFPFGDPALNDAGQIAFKATLTRAGDSIWATDRTGALSVVVRRGDLLEIAPGIIRAVEFLDFVGGTGGSDGRPSSFNNYGQIAFAARFYGGGEGIFVSNAVAVPEPSALILAGLAALTLIASRRVYK